MGQGIELYLFTFLFLRLQVTYWSVDVLVGF